MSDVATVRHAPRWTARLERDPFDRDLLDLVAAAGFDQPLFYMEKPDDGEAMLSLGAMTVIRSFGAGRFGAASAAATAVIADIGVSEPEGPRVAGEGGDGWTELGLRLVGGFGFADECRSEVWRDFAPCVFVLPKEQWIRANGAAVHVTLEGPVDDEGGATPGRRDEPPSAADATVFVDGESDDHWLARARAAIAEVEAGRLGKIVLARHESHRIADDLDIAGILRRLRADRPSCYTFCFALGRSVFLGSSPEKLVSVRGAGFEADALAGTSARGCDADQDRKRGGALLASAKDRLEHDAVVEGIRASLAPLATKLQIDAEPELRAFPEGFHLRTTVRGELANGASVFEAVAALHPTPAVCGLPRERARALLDRIEADRGWYSGGVGWLAPGGDALFAVALRAGIWRDGRLAAWAGAGIVRGSEAERELAEIELKMRALLAAVETRAAMP